MLKEITFLTLLIGVNCWWDEGHSTVAEIAQQTLPKLLKDDNAEFLDKIKQLLQLWYDEDNVFRIHEAAVWPDTIKENNNGISSMKEWHFIDLPYYYPPVDQKLVDNVTKLTLRATSTVAWNIEECMKTFSTQRKSKWAQSFQLRNLLHFVGDICQPFHCINGFFRYSYLKPGIHQDMEWSDLFHETIDSSYHEDRGGNLYKINVDFNDEIKNMHALWDSVGGEYLSRSPYSNESLKRLKLNATQLIDSFPISDNDLICNKKSIYEWTQESHNLAIKYGYNSIKPHSSWTREDPEIQNVIKISKQQLTKSGYRLAACLSQLIL